MAPELNLLFLVIAALAGLTIKKLLGFNPYTFCGALATVILVLEILGFALENDPEVLQQMVNSYI